MHTFRQFHARFQRTWAQLPSWVSVLLFVALFVGAGSILWQKQQVKPRTSAYLLNGRRFTDSQLGPMLKAFSKAKLTTYTLDDGRLRVPQAEMARYLAALADQQALPRDFQSHTDAALSESSLFETDRERQRRMRHAAEKDLAMAIGAMPGIDNAMVTYDETEPHGFQGQRVVTACVAVLPSAGQVLDRQHIRTIRQLVVAARAGLQPENVSVTDLRSRRAWIGGQDDDALVPRAQEYLEMKRSVEKDWQLRVREALPGVRDAQVVVHVDLPKELPASLDADPQRWLEPESISVLVAVPGSYIERIWQSQLAVGGDGTTSGDGAEPSGTREELRARVTEQIRQAVIAILPSHLDPAAAVTVNLFEDPAPPVARPWWHHPRVRWLQERLGPHRTQLAAGLGITCLLTLLLAWRRRQQAPAEPDIVPLGPLGERWNQRLASHPAAEQAEDLEELRSSLMRIVRENPDEAAAVLNRWLDRAG